MLLFNIENEWEKEKNELEDTDGNGDRKRQCENA